MFILPVITIILSLMIEDNVLKITKNASLQFLRNDWLRKHQALSSSNQCKFKKIP